MFSFLNKTFGSNSYSFGESRKSANILSDFTYRRTWPTLELKGKSVQQRRCVRMFLLYATVYGCASDANDIPYLTKG